MTQPVIEVQNLTYYYPGKKALEDVSFTIEKGSITALVGPNGAGKSTLLRSLAGLDQPFSGKIGVAGIDVLEDPRRAHTKVGYLSDDFGLYSDLTVRDVLMFIGGCHNFFADVLQKHIDWAVHTLKLESVLNQKCGTLSRGWRQRTGIAMAILHQPEVLLLDEPASGLDPEARSELSSIMRDLQARGITSLVSSHILAELEEYCTAMLVLRDGTIKQHVSLQSHRETQKVKLLVSFASPLTREQEAILSTLAAQPLLNASRLAATIPTLHDPASQNALLKSMMENTLPVCGFTLEETSLQSLYLETTGQGNKS